MQHKNSYSDSYRDAGVDVTAGYKAVELMKAHVARTRTPGVLTGIGGFGGLFEPDFGGMNRPVLVSGTDGVGTKLQVAIMMNRHDTVGIDCVAMCVNDIVCCGARPLFFLDYLAMGKNIPEKTAQLVAGVAEGCVRAGCALIGGETAEHPGVMPADDYDMAGFAVGMVDRDKMLDGSGVRAGDAIIGLASSGVHSNGFSLVRKVLRVTPERLAAHFDELGGTLGETLLTPTRIYVKPLLAAMAAAPVKSVSHITGGGFYENIPRALPAGMMARIERRAVNSPPVFDMIARTGGLSEREMFNTFNMGVGMCLIVPPEACDAVLSVLRAEGETAGVIGEVAHGDEGLVLC